MRFYTGKMFPEKYRNAIFVARHGPWQPSFFVVPSSSCSARVGATTPPWSKPPRGPCGVCHNPDFSGREQMLRLANQREDYLLKAMREYKSGSRIGYAGAMATELQRLSGGDLQDVAHFFAHLPRPPR